MQMADQGDGEMAESGEQCHETELNEAEHKEEDIADEVGVIEVCLFVASRVSEPCHAAIVNIVFADSSLDVKLILLRGQKEFVHQIGFAHFNVLATANPTDVLQKLSENINVDVEGESVIFTPHYLKPLLVVVTNSKGERSLLCHQEDRRVGDELMHISFIQDLVYPFVLELSILRRGGHKIFYRVEPRFYRELCAACSCVDLSSGVFTGISTPTGHAPRLMFGDLISTIFFDKAVNSIFIHSIESARLVGWVAKRLGPNYHRQMNIPGGAFSQRELEKDIRRTVQRALDVDEGVAPSDDHSPSEEAAASPPVVLRPPSAAPATLLGTKAIKSRTAQDPAFEMLLVALRTEASSRSAVQVMAVVKLLLSCPVLSRELCDSSPAELRALANACTLRQAKAGEELVGAGEAVSDCYLVLSGSLSLPAHLTVGVEEVFGSPTPCWPCSVSVTESAGMCLIPQAALLRFAGRRGRECQDYLGAFWKYTRLSSELGRAHASFSLFEVLDDVEAAPVQKSLGRVVRDEGQAQGQGEQRSERKEQLSAWFGQPVEPALWQQCARIRIYPPGAELFSQGQDRWYLFFVLAGECSHLRRVRQEAKSEVELDVGLRLYAGDFSMLDGEASWVEQRRRSPSGPLRVLAPRGNEYLDARGRRAWVWGQHRHSLHALTRVEALVMPLAELARSGVAFIKLAALAASRYTALGRGDAELLAAQKREEVVKEQVRSLAAQHLDQYNRLKPTASSPHVSVKVLQTGLVPTSPALPRRTKPSLRLI